MTSETRCIDCAHFDHQGRLVHEQTDGLTRAGLKVVDYEIGFCMWPDDDAERAMPIWAMEILRHIPGESIRADRVHPYPCPAFRFQEPKDNG